MPQRVIPIRTRHFVPQRWNVVLVNAAGTRYDLGSVPITDTSATILIPGSVPDGVYDVEITADGLAWRGVVQKGIGSVTIDSGTSVPEVVGLPLFTNFSYEIDSGWVKLKWNGDVPKELSGLVSAGLWFGYGIPDFTQAPSVTIPLFHYETQHQYIMKEQTKASVIGVDVWLFGSAYLVLWYFDRDIDLIGDVDEWSTKPCPVFEMEVDGVRQSAIGLQKFSSRSLRTRVSGAVVAGGRWWLSGDPSPYISSDVPFRYPSAGHIVDYHYPFTGYQMYAGLAPIGADGSQGAGQYIALPDRTVLVPPATILEG